MKKLWGLLPTGLLALVCLHCADDSNFASDAIGAEPGSGTAGSTSQSPGAAGNFGTAGDASGVGARGPVVVPPETELERSFLAPVVTGNYVFSANPSSGRVAVIDAKTYGVRLFNAGFGPKYLGAVPGEHAVVVINELSDDATLFALDGEDVSVAATSLPLHDGANAWAMSPNGRFAIAWTQTPVEQKLDATAGSQTVTVLDLEARNSFQLTVGFHPTQVVVDSQSSRAFVVSDDGISVIALGDQPKVSLLAAVSKDPLGGPTARDVSILPDGSLAIVRVDGSSELRFVDLSQEDSLQVVDLGVPITDVDLSLDGKLVICALPGVGQVAIVPLPLDPASTFQRVNIPNEIASSLALSADAELALLFQNGADNSHLSLLDLHDAAAPAVRTLDLKGPVRAAFVAPGAASAIVFQKPLPGSAKAGLISFVPTLQKRSPKVVGTDAVPSALAFDQDGKTALVTVGNDTSAVRGVYRVRLDTLQSDFVELASPPAVGATGIVESARRGFVAQVHPEGRITFVDLETAQAHTITGFELAARILQ